VLSRVLYSGTHAGDVITVDAFPQLKSELATAAEYGEQQDCPDLCRFARDMNDLIIAAESEGNPIVF
jgi:hypothetical protein